MKIGLDPELASLWLRALSASDDLTQAEQFRFRLLIGQVVDDLLLVYKRYKRGTVSQEDLDRHANMMRDALKARGLVSVWKIRRAYYPDDFVSLMEALMTAPSEQDFYPELRRGPKKKESGIETTS